jgi:hypothetical protein
LNHNGRHTLYIKITISPKKRLFNELLFFVKTIFSLNFKKFK